MTATVGTTGRAVARVTLGSGAVATGVLLVGVGPGSAGGRAGLVTVDELRIDRRFVDGLGVRSEDEALVRAVLALAADLGLRVVAEGVETPEQARVLVGLGCGTAQGMLYGSAVPIERLGPGDPDLRDVPWPVIGEHRPPSVATDRIGA